MSGHDLADEAIALLRRAQRRYPQDYWINHDLAFLLLSQVPNTWIGKWEEGSQVDPNVVDSDPSLLDFPSVRKVSEAARFATVAVALRADSLGARLTLAEILERRESYTEAVEVLKEIIHLKKNYVLAYVRLGRNLEALERPEEARKLYREALELEAEDPGEYYALGVSFGLQKQWSDAQTAYEKAIERNPAGIPNYIQFVMNAVETCETEQEPKPALALAIARRAAQWLGRKSGSRPALYILASGMRGEPALAVYQCVLGSQDVDLDYITRCRIGTIQLDLEKHQEAVPILMAAVALKPDCFLAHELLGKALDKGNQLADATREYREAMSLLQQWSHEATIGKGSVRKKMEPQGGYGYLTAMVQVPGIDFQEITSSGVHARALAISGRLQNYTLADVRIAAPRTPSGASAASAAASAHTKSWSEKKKADPDTAAESSATASSTATGHFPARFADSGGVNTDADGANSSSVARVQFSAPPPIEWYLAGALFRQNRLDEALELLRKPTLAISGSSAAAASGASSAGTARNDTSASVAAAIDRNEIDAPPADRLGYLALFLEQYYSADVALKAQRRRLELDPSSLEPYAHIGSLLNKLRQKDEAKKAYQKIIGDEPGLGRLAIAKIFLDTGKLDEMIEILSEVKPEDGPDHAAVACLYRGSALVFKAELAKGAAAFEEGIRIKADLAALHAARVVLNTEPAAQCLRVLELAEKQNPFIETKQKLRTIKGAIPAKGWLKIGMTLKAWHNGEARKAFTLAARSEIAAAPDWWSMIDPKTDHSDEWYEAGQVLLGEGMWEDAATAFRRVAPTSMNNNLGVALFRLGKLDDAATELQRYILLDNQEVRRRVFYQLSHVHYRLGKQEEADREIRVAAGLESPERAKRLSGSLDKLPAFLKGEYKPASVEAKLDLAEACLYRGYNLACAKLYAELFSADPKLGDRILTGSSTYRYDAVCAAALVAGGQGDDVADLKESDRAKWRKQALEWLRDDLKFHNARVEADPQTLRGSMNSQLNHWRRDIDLVAIRAEADVAKMPESERQLARQLWAEVDASLHRGKK